MFLDRGFAALNENTDFDHTEKLCKRADFCKANPFRAGSDSAGHAGRALRMERRMKIVIS
jgi:hypothetical protein